MARPCVKGRYSQCAKYSLLTLDISNASRYYSVVIINFKDAETERFWKIGNSLRIPKDVHVRALKKLFILQAAVTLDNLRVPPGNRLEALQGDRKGQHSIRINDQYRICFVWRDGNASDVEITDYH